MIKICNGCKIPKELDQFSKDKTRSDGLSYKCKICAKTITKNSVAKNKIKYIQKQNEYYQNNKKEHLLRNKNYIKKNKIKYNLYQKEYNIKNKDKIKIYKNQYKLYQYNNNVEYKILVLLRSRLRTVLNSSNINKSNKTIELLGCTIEQFKQHLEQQFKPEMNWLNHGEIWEIDHIKACDNFDLTIIENQFKCFHYSNMQPLFKTTKIAESFGYTNEIGNREKSNK